MIKRNTQILGPSSSSPMTLSNLQSQLASFRHRASQQMMLRPATLPQRNVNMMHQYCRPNPTTSDQYQQAFDTLYLSLVGRPSSGAARAMESRNHTPRDHVRPQGKRKLSDMSTTCTGEENDPRSSNQVAIKKMKTDPCTDSAVVKDEPQEPEQNQDSQQNEFVPEVKSTSSTPATTPVP